MSYRGTGKLAVNVVHNYVNAVLAISKITKCE